MNEDMNSTMRDAMLHMKAGDLRAATAAILGRLNGGCAIAPSNTATSRREDTIEGEFRSLDEPMAEEKGFAESSSVPASAFEGQAQFSEHVYSGGAGTRRYKLFTPSAYRGQPLPLIVMLHGCTQTPDDFATGTRMNVVAEDRGCFVVYPEQAQSANASKCWNWFKPGDQRRDQGEPAIIAGLVRELLVRHGLDRSRVYAAGLSAGGAMAAILGKIYPDLFAAVGVHSGLPHGAAHDLPSALAAMHRGNASPSHTMQPEGHPAWQGGTPSIVFHGDRDTTVHPCNGAKVASESAAAGSDGSGIGAGLAAASVDRGVAAKPGGHGYTRTLYRQHDGKIVVEHWLVHGAAHAWFGGDPRGSYTDAKGPDASSEMARFFLERVGGPGA